MFGRTRGNHSISIGAGGDRERLQILFGRAIRSLAQTGNIFLQRQFIDDIGQAALGRKNIFQRTAIAIIVGFPARHFTLVAQNSKIARRIFWNQTQIVRRLEIKRPAFENIRTVLI